MGEAFMSKCAPQFRHQQDKAFVQEMKSSNLFSDRQEVASSMYTCMLDDGAPVVQGDSLLIMRNESGMLVPTIMNVAVGIFDPSDQNALTAVFKSSPRCGGVAVATVLDVSSFGGATIRLLEE